MKQMQVSPFAEAATALRNILCRSPSHFATPQVLTALAGACLPVCFSSNVIIRLIHFNAISNIVCYHLLYDVT